MEINNHQEDKENLNNISSTNKLHKRKIEAKKFTAYCTIISFTTLFLVPFTLIKVFSVFVTIIFCLAITIVNVLLLLITYNSYVKNGLILRCISFYFSMLFLVLMSILTIMVYRVLEKTN